MEISEIFKNLSFSEEEYALLDTVFEKLHLNKGSSLLKTGDPVEYQYFIAQGCLRTFYLDKSAKEHTVQFAVQDWWISDYTAFFSNSKATLNIECLQDSQVFKVSRSNLEELFIQIPRLETFFRKKLEGAFSSFQKRILANLSQSAKERYLDFVASYPNIEQSVKNYHIASYLGVTTETLSRIRREISSK